MGVNADNAAYYHFTGPQRVDKAVHTLEGLLQGVAADRSANEGEVALLRRWLMDHNDLRNRHPFNELMPPVEDAVTIGVGLDEEQVADLIWLCSKMRSDNHYFNDVTSDMQRLQGMMGGIAADGVITMEELDVLSEWVQEHEDMKTLWPYDELESLLIGVRRDGRIDPAEHALLLRFFAEFTTDRDHRAVGKPAGDEEETTPIGGLCAVCPDIAFEGKTFCFTGRSVRLNRTELARLVEAYGGNFRPHVLRETDYLVVGADGNPCWAYACYGRKVELAIKYRRAGCRMAIVHENDFWDALQDRRAEGI